MSGTLLREDRASSSSSAPDSSSSGVTLLPACTKGAMMADSSRRSEDDATLLFGGAGNVNPLWSLKGSWEMVSNLLHAKPSSRAKGSFCRLDETRMVLFAGSDDDNKYYNDTWIFDEEKKRWVELLYRDSTLVVFGGKDGKTREPLGDLWLLDLSPAVAHVGETGQEQQQGKMEWIKVKGPAEFPGKARKGHTAVMLGDAMLVFGGRESDTSYFSDLFVLHFSAVDHRPTHWTLVEPVNGKSHRPRERNHHVAVALSENEMFMYGGRSDHFQDLNQDAWVFNLARNEWRKLDPLPDRSLPALQGFPVPRIEAACAKRSRKNAIVIATGQDAFGNAMNDAWQLNVDGPNSFAWNRLQPVECLTTPTSPQVSSAVALTSVGVFIGMLVLLLAYFALVRRRRSGYAVLS